ncbi:MAG: glycosyltransferase [Planctomycetota bacterium]
MAQDSSGPLRSQTRQGIPLSGTFIDTLAPLPELDQPGIELLEGTSRDSTPPPSDAADWIAELKRFYNRVDPRGLPKTRRYYSEQIERRVRRLVLPGSRVLDIGCGTGELLAALRPAIGVGVDLREHAIHEARNRHPHLRFMHMPGETVQSLGDTFDHVILGHVLGQVYCLQTLFDSLHSVCHARTRIIIVHYNRLWQPMLYLMERLGIKQKPPEQNWLPADEVCHLLSLSGFETIRQFGMTLLPIQIPLVSTLCNRFLGNLPLLHCLGLNYVLVARSLDPKVLKSRKPKSVSIVVPARNEAGNIQPLLDRIPRLAQRQEIIFVEGGSRDETWAAIQDAARDYSGPFRVLAHQQPGTGKADAVRKGFSEATGDALVILDADISVPPEELPAFFNALATGRGEMINGSRMVYLMDAKAMRFLNLLANKAFGWMFTYLLSQPFRDTLCGTKVLLREDYLRIADDRKQMGDFDPFGDFELLFGAARLNLKIVDVPVHYKARTYGETNISRFRHGWILLRMCQHAARKIKFV